MRDCALQWDLTAVMLTGIVQVTSNDRDSSSGGRLSIAEGSKSNEHGVLGEETLDSLDAIVVITNLVLLVATETYVGKHLVQGGKSLVDEYVWVFFIECHGVQDA